MEFKKPEKSWLQNRLKSFIYAKNGIHNLIKKEHNAWIHFIALILAIVLGIFLKLTMFEWIAITIVSGIVIVSELFNTAIEQLADKVEPNLNKKIGLIKDYCAGAVFVSAIISVIVGGLIFIPRILGFIKCSC